MLASPSSETAKPGSACGPVFVPLAPLTTEVLSVNPLTLLPTMAKFWKSCRNMRVKDGFTVLFRNMPEPTVALASAPVLFEMVPPEHPVVLALVQVPAFPVTVRPAVAPVLSRIMPLFEPLVEDMERNV